MKPQIGAHFVHLHKVDDEYLHILMVVKGQLDHDKDLYNCLPEMYRVDIEIWPHQGVMNGIQGHRRDINEAIRTNSPRLFLEREIKRVRAENELLQEALEKTDAVLEKTESLLRRADDVLKNEIKRRADD